METDATLSATLGADIGTTLGPEDIVLPGATLGHPPLLDHIRLAASNGFAGVSIRTADYLEALATGLALVQIRRAIADAGLLVGDIDCVAPILGTGQPGGEFYGATEDDVLRCAEALSARSVNLILQKNREATATPEAVVEATAADAARVADRAADIGVLVHLEPIPFMDIKDAVTALEVVAEADRPNLGIQIDAWHHFRGPIPADAHATGEVTAATTTAEAMAESCGVFFSFPAQHIFAIQVCDAGPPQGRPFEDTMKRRLFPGQGEFPLAALLATLRLIGCRAPISVEVFSDSLLPAQQASTARQAAESTRTLMDESAATLKAMLKQFS